MRALFVFLVFAISDPLCYLIFTLCVHGIPSDVCLRLCLVFTGTHAPGQWAEHVAPPVKARTEVVLHFIHFPSETIDRYQQSDCLCPGVSSYCQKKQETSGKRITWTVRYIVSKTSRRVGVYLTVIHKIIQSNTHIFY